MVYLYLTLTVKMVRNNLQTLSEDRFITFIEWDRNELKNWNIKINLMQRDRIRQNRVKIVAVFFPYAPMRPHGCPLSSLAQLL